MNKFLKEVKEEFSKVVWPGKNEIINSTFLVVALSVCVGAYLGLFDLLFEKLLGVIIK